jgi:hypothetical protein
MLKTIGAVGVSEIFTVAALCALACGCSETVFQTQGPASAQTKDGPSGILFVGGPSVGSPPVPATEIERKAAAPGGYTVSGADIRRYDQDTIWQAVLGGALAVYPTAGAKGAIVGSTVNARFAGIDPHRLDEFYTMLREGYVPVNFWTSTQPPVRVRVILYSNPNVAKLFIDGAPTSFLTIADLYMLPEDIHESTLEMPGYAPCRVASAIVPGLQQSDGREALTVRCNLMPLSSGSALKQGHQNGR